MKHEFGYGDKVQSKVDGRTGWVVTFTFGGGFDVIWDGINGGSQEYDRGVSAESLILTKAWIDG